MWRADLSLLFGSILWGLSWIPLKALESAGMDGIFLNFFCYGLLSIAFLPFLWRTKSYLGSLSHGRSSKLAALVGIACVGGLANVSFVYALMYGDVIRVMVLFYLLPVWGVLGGTFILKESTDWLRWFGVACAVIGAFVLLGGAKVFQSPPELADWAGLVSGMCIAGNNLIFRAVPDLPLSNKLSVLFLGCTILAGVLILAGVESIPQDIEPRIYLYAAAFGLIWLLLSNCCSQWGVTQMAAGRSSIIIIFELIAAVVSAIMIGGDTLGTTKLLGGILVLVATATEITRQVDKSST